MEYLLETNPWFGNPRKRRKSRKRRKNPVAKVTNPKVMGATMKEWTQGVDLMDMVAGAGGLVAASMLPAALIKTDTTGMKVLKIALALGAAVGAGSLARSMISASAGKSAVIGGLAGTGLQILATTTGVQLLGTQKMLAPARRRIGETTLVSPPPTRDAEIVSVIQP